MKRMTAIAGLAAWICSLTLVAAPQGPRGGRWRLYDPQTEVTFQGVVEKVIRVTHHRGGREGIHLAVKSGNDTYDVRVGPANFVEKTMTFKDGDTIQVTGSRVMVMGKSAILARQITKGNQTLKLREANGMPLWRGMRTPIS
ncbi:MAG TPA: DNA-binding protein [Terriglobia bacterium]|nr:DNA-binding protein [Terriglobia bacterium]